jgi:type IV secretion system protein VirD4
MLLNEHIAHHGPPRSVVNIPLDPKIKKQALTKLYVSTLFYIVLAMWIGTEIVAAMLGFPAAFKSDEYIQYVYAPWSEIWPWGKLWTGKLPDELAGRVHLALEIAYGVTIIGSIIAFVLGRRNAHAHIEDAPRATDWHGGAHWAEPIEVGATGALPPDHWASIAAGKAANKTARQNRRKPPFDLTPDAIAARTKAWHDAPCVFLGEWLDKKTGKRMWLRDATDKHLALFAPTRGGKGVGIIIPTCLTWKESLVVNDPKGELYDNTAGWRKTALKQRIFRFDPMCNDGTGARINVIDFVRLKTDNEVADAQNIAKMICDPLGLGLDTGGDSDHWRKTAYAFLTSVILHILYTYANEPIGKKITRANMAGIDDFLSDPSHTVDEMLDKMINYEHDPEFIRGWYDTNGQPTRVCPEVAKGAADLKNKPEGERGSTLSTVKSYLDLYRDPTVARNTEKSDFSFEDLMYAERGATLYLINNPNNMERIRPLMRLIVNMLMTTFTGSVEFDERGQQKPKYKHRLLILMDEFTSTLGKMSIFSNAISFVAGFGIRVMIVVQDKVQLAETYGESGAQSLTSNIHTSIAYATNNQTTASSISEMLGEGTVRQENVSHNAGKKSVSESFIGKRLLTPSDVARLPDTDQLIVMTGHPPIYATKIKYYEEPWFIKRGKKAYPPPTHSDHIPHPGDLDYTVESGQAYYKQMPKLLAAAQEAANVRKEERSGSHLPLPKTQREREDDVVRTLTDSIATPTASANPLLTPRSTPPITSLPHLPNPLLTSDDDEREPLI